MIADEFNSACGLAYYRITDYKRPFTFIGGRLFSYTFSEIGRKPLITELNEMRND